MNIIYVAFSSSIGLGGHIRSMRDICETIEPSLAHIEIIIICAKPQSNYINGVNYLFLKDGYKKNTSFFKKINKPDSVVHYFDIESYSYFCLTNIKKYIITRCGGVNPNIWPKSLLTTTFSNENYNHFKNLGVKKLTYIPNRVKNFNFDLKLVEEIKGKFKINNDDFVILRVSRIKKYYDESIQQTLRLGHETSKKLNKKATVLIIGGIEDYNIYESINTLSKSMNIRLIFITDSKYTSEARHIISIASIIVGTGRSLMEAAKTNAELYVPNKGEDLPLKLTSQNFKKLFSLNFSGRYYVKFNKNETPIQNDIIWNKYFFINKNTIEKYIQYYNFEHKYKPNVFYRIFLHFKLRLLILKNF